MITGLMQIGIGVTDINETFEWYSSVLGFSIKVFDDTSEASTMSAYAGEKTYWSNSLS